MLNKDGISIPETLKLERTLEETISFAKNKLFLMQNDMVRYGEDIDTEIIRLKYLIPIWVELAILTNKGENLLKIWKIPPYQISLRNNFPKVEEIKFFSKDFLLEGLSLRIFEMLCREDLPIYLMRELKDIEYRFFIVLDLDKIC